DGLLVQLHVGKLVGGGAILVRQEKERGHAEAPCLLALMCAAMRSITGLSVSYASVSCSALVVATASDHAALSSSGVLQLSSFNAVSSSHACRAARRSFSSYSLPTWA